MSSITDINSINNIRLIVNNLNEMIVSQITSLSVQHKISTTKHGCIKNDFPDQFFDFEPIPDYEKIFTKEFYDKISVTELEWTDQYSSKYPRINFRIEITLQSVKYRHNMIFITMLLVITWTNLGNSGCQIM